MNINSHISRGVGTFTGLLVIALGAWAALVPFLVSPDEAWGWRFNGFVLAVLPGAAAALGGLSMLGGKRLSLPFGALLALIGGLWFMVWPVASVVWAAGPLGAPLGDAGLPTLKWIVFYGGTGVMITLLSAYALGWLDALPITREPVEDITSARTWEWAACQPGRTRRAVRRPQAQRQRPRHGARLHARHDDYPR